jgi:hypothetical protein
MEVVAGLLALALIGAPLVCWAMLARVPAIRWGIGLVLALFIAGIVGLSAGWIDTRARLELFVGFAPASAAVVGVGLLLQRKRVRELPPLHPHRRAGRVLLLSYLALMVLCCTPVAIRMENEPYTPSDGELLPLPSGLVVVEDKELGCGSGVCSRSFTIGSSDGASPEQIAAVVRSHLAVSHGWEDSPKPCRPNGWLIDRSELCVLVAVGPDRQVHVLFEGARESPTYEYR